MKSIVLPCIAFLSLQPASAATEEEYKTASMQLVIAASCRATYGEDELFEVAFSRFEQVARSTEAPLRNSEIKETKQKMYELDAMEGGNPFLKAFCEKLKEEFLPK